MFKIALRILLVIIIVLVLGIIGFLIGATIGGNYAQEFVFNGLKGYEAVGQIGFFIGVVMGLFLGWRLLFKRKVKA